MRPALALLSLVLLASLTAAWSGAVSAADRQAADPLAPDEAPPPAEMEATGEPVGSPWEHALWHNATSMMRVYICDHARRPPQWCGDQHRELPANVPLPDPQGPPLVAEDAAWLAFLEAIDPANLTPEQVALVRRRAVERRDPQAMEILGYLYAEGLAVERDFAEAYRWYGLAFLAGEKRVRANMDIVWDQLQRYDVESALVLTREFDALAAGEVPEGFATPLPAKPQ